jgi:hypothetical protein
MVNHHPFPSDSEVTVKGAYLGISGQCVARTENWGKLPLEALKTLIYRVIRGTGQEWIRTTEGVSQRIYSPPRLATSVPTRFPLHPRMKG